MAGARTVAAILTLAALACASTAPAADPPSTAAPPAPTLAGESVFDQPSTAYGFFPSPPEITLESVLRHFGDLGDHADFVLAQPNIPWQAWEPEADVEAEPQSLIDLRNQAILAEQNGLEMVFVVDPLKGLNRREFLCLPDGWDASFAVLYLCDPTGAGSAPDSGTGQPKPYSDCAGMRPTAALGGRVP